MPQNYLHTVSSPQKINRSFMISIVFNTLYVVVEIIYGLENNSTSLLSDAAHNVGDEIKAHLKPVSGVMDIHHIHIGCLSTNENAMPAHILIGNMNCMSSIKKTMKAELEEINISHCTLEFELLIENYNESDL